ncbi:tyrosine-type recombinase/integrase [Georgenia muralis]
MGTYGDPYYEETDGGRQIAVVRFRDFDGRTRKIKAVGRSKAEALRRLKKKIANHEAASVGEEDLTADSLFVELADAWLQSLDDTKRLAPSTRYRYERDLRTLVLPAFENYALREITVRKVDRLLKQLHERSYDRAQKAKVVLNLAFKLAVRWEVLDRNPVTGVDTLRRPPREAQALTLETVRLVRSRVAEWRQGADGKPGPRPDGQILAIIETMLGTLARIDDIHLTTVRYPDPGR